jgi:kynurenine formamidase
MKIIADLSYPVTSGMPVFPGDGETKLTRVRELCRDGYRLTRLDTSLHAGTHIDMPSHLTADGRMVTDLDIRCFSAPCVMLDCTGCTEIDYRPEYAGLIKSGDALLIRTSFADMYTEPERYYSAYPVLAPAFADFLCESGIAMLGLDNPSPDREPYSLHKRLLKRGIFIVENLTNLSALVGLAPRSFTFMALPLRIDAEASPVRAVALG